MFVFYSRKYMSLIFIVIVIFLRYIQEYRQYQTIATSDFVQFTYMVSNLKVDGVGQCQVQMDPLAFVLPDCEQYVAGDKLEIIGKVEQPSDKSPIGQISLTVQSIRRNGTGLISGMHLFFAVERKILLLKSSIENRAAHFLDPNAFALFASLLFGERNFFRGSLKTNIVRLHLGSFIMLNAYAVSILEILLFTKLKLFVPRRLWGAILVPFVFILFVFSQFSIILLRLLLGSFLFAVSLLFKRQASAKHTFYLSVGFLLLLNPFLIYNKSLQFAAAVLFGIFLWQPIAQKILFKVRWLRKKTLRATIVKRGLQILSVSLSAQFFVLPLIFYYFGEYDVASFAAHLVLFFLVPVLITVNFGYALVIFGSSLDAMLVSFVNEVALIFTKLLSFLAQFSGIIVLRQNFSASDVIFWWLGVLFMWFCMKCVFFSRKSSF